MQSPGSNLQRVGAYLVHVYTACGVVFALLAAIAITADEVDPRAVFLWLIAAVIVDATDGPLARAFHVKRNAPAIDGRTIDDIVDYLTFTFLPLLLVARMNWVPQPVVPWCALAMVASLMGFANTHAKQESGGFFLGFPSYWNIYAFYAGIIAAMGGEWINLVLLLICAVLTVLPVRFIYPNLAPGRWKVILLVGSAVWLVALLAMLPRYPDIAPWLFWLSLVFPAIYVAASVMLDVQDRRIRKSGTSSPG